MDGHASWGFHQGHRLRTSSKDFQRTGQFLVGWEGTLKDKWYQSHKRNALNLEVDFWVYFIARLCSTQEVRILQGEVMEENLSIPFGDHIGHSNIDMGQWNIWWERRPHLQRPPQGFMSEHFTQNLLYILSLFVSLLSVSSVVSFCLSVTNFIPLFICPSTGDWRASLASTHPTHRSRVHGPQTRTCHQTLPPHREDQNCLLRTVCQMKMILLWNVFFIKDCL